MGVVNLDGRVQKANWVQNRWGSVSIFPDQIGKESDLEMLEMEGLKGNQTALLAGRCDSTTTVMVV
jgi:hypothetical protein